MLIRFGYALTFECPRPTLMMCFLDSHDACADGLRYEAPLVATPPVAPAPFLDVFGNRGTSFIAPAGVLTLSRDSIVESSGLPDAEDHEAQETHIRDLPCDVFAFLQGSRYCETDKLADIAWSLFGTTPRGWKRVSAICDFVHRHMTFGYKHARPTRTAYEAFTERVGVCRDFTQLAVTFCRCMNIPARYVNGFLPEIGVPPSGLPRDYNAWLEAYLDGRWHTFDARHNRPRIGRIIVARGRDAADVPLVTSFGPHALQTFRVWTDEVDASVLDMLTRRSA
jgi:transglutaminase-like putative cysteine protease